ncbi:MAG: (2Fe-2S) ferredoxin domain-containing protein [Clostridia bacterium]|nr:(2Fe-2S) ferredoxin domain-containing protein [Clostridia bacterium]MDR3645664.1 (2Fe-2S) ferredoxin domain-containing protein [Clostridia bacterium]
MKSLAELEVIRERTKKKINVSESDGNDIRVVVGMATCGIAAGARPVYDMLIEEVEKHNLHNVSITQTGCIGICQLEPVVEIYAPGKEKVTYVKMTPEKARRIVTDHIVNDTIVAEYTVGSVVE